MKLLAQALTRLLSWLPLVAGRRLAAWLGLLMSRIGTDMARVTRINLARCFPDLEPAAREDLVRRSLEHTACLLFESGPLTHWSRARLEKLVVAEAGRTTLTASLTKGGTLMLVPHFGNWEFICFALGSLQLVALYDPPRVRSLEQPLRYARQRFGARLHPANAAGLRVAYRQLQAGGLVCLLPDQVPEGRGGVHAPFFGHPALTMTLPHRMIQRTRPTVLLGSARRVEDGFRLVYEPMPDAIHADEPETFAAALNQAVENLVQRDPAQYQWEYKRFKHAPQGHPLVYPKRGETTGETI